MLAIRPTSVATTDAASPSLAQRRVGAHLHHRRGEREEVLDTAAVGDLLRAERVVLGLQLPQALALLVQYRVRGIQRTLQIGDLRSTHDGWEGGGRPGRVTPWRDDVEASDGTNGPTMPAAARAA